MRTTSNDRLLAAVGSLLRVGSRTAARFESVASCLLVATIAAAMGGTRSVLATSIASKLSEPPKPRKYFSERQGRGPRARALTLDEFKRLSTSVWESLDHQYYLQEAFGYKCVDAGEVEGYLGLDPGAHFLRVLHRDDVWPWR